MHMAAFLGRQGDGELEPRELQELRTTCITLATQAGADQEEAFQEAAEAIARALATPLGEAAADFERRTQAVVAALGHRPEVLQALYRELVQIAGADREVGAGERLVLDRIKERWALG